MHIALFGKGISGFDPGYIQGLIDKLHHLGAEVSVFAPFAEALAGKITFTVPPNLYSSKEEITGKADHLFSIGGDGTLLDTITLVGDSGIPVTGINLGRLGFLSCISREEIGAALDEIFRKNYILEPRSLLMLETSDQLFGSFNFALNDLTVYKNRPLAMLSIKTYVNDEFLNTYWADGLIVATPTGSTAYSMSCTGPIITPDAENFVITPIASHNLTVRPIVLRDDCRIRIVVGGRDLDCSVGLDSRVQRIENPLELTIRKAEFKINLLRLSNQSFYNTIRSKLNWGLDSRN